MDSQITIRELTAPNDIALFWEQLYAYFCRDIMPDPADEDLPYFLGSEYRAAMEGLHAREADPLHYLFFERRGQQIGFASAVLYHSEDGKCLLPDFCVLPEFRGSGTGRSCAGALLDWGRSHGATYFELNVNTDWRRRFWQSVGFSPNGADQWGMPLLLLPPEKMLPFTVERLADPEDAALGWQLHKLENGFLSEIGEDPLTDKKKSRLSSAIREGRIVFFLVRRGYRAVGMCSVAPCFSTFTCETTGVFDDFFVEPAFRRQGAARLLTDAAQAWCREQGYASLTVGCSAGDVGMYRALGFSTELGTMLAWDAGK